MPSVVYEAILDSWTVKQVYATSVNPGLKQARAKASGAVASSQVALISADPVISISTSDLAGAIGALSATAGLVLSSANTIPFADRADGAAFQGTLSHQTISFVNGLAVPVELSATQDSEEGATFKVEVYPCAATDPGQTSPFTYNTGVSLVSSTFVNMYDLGPLKIASTFVVGVKSISVKFGITVKRDRYGGQVWPLISGTYITSVDPVISVTFEDTASMQTAGEFAATASTITAYFRKRTAGSAHIANATAENVSCTLTGGMNMMTDVSGSGMDANMSLTREFHGLSLAFSAAAAIS
jgi:hypothetical protein